MVKMIGLSRSVKLEWLNKTVELILEEKTEAEIKDELNEYLAFEIKSPTNLRKTRDILMNIWVRTPDKYSKVRQQAILTFKDDKSSKLAIHWGMILIAYPVFADVCGLIGKLTSIQDTFTTAWLKETLCGVWGERTTLLHSSDKILQTLRYIGAIENKKMGVYKVKKHEINDTNAIQVLLMAIMKLEEKAYYEVSELSSIPQLFPFEFLVSYEWIHNLDCFKISNFGGKIAITVD